MLRAIRSMRELFVSCAAAGSLLLGAAGVAASQGVAGVTTAEQMVKAWDHLGTTRGAPSRTTRTSPHSAQSP